MVLWPWSPRGYGHEMDDLFVFCHGLFCGSPYIFVKEGVEEFSVDERKDGSFCVCKGHVDQLHDRLPFSVSVGIVVCAKCFSPS